MVGTFWRLILVCALAVPACKRKSDKSESFGAVRRAEAPVASAQVGAAVPAGSLAAASFRYRFAVYTEQALTPAARHELAQLTAAAGFTLVDAKANLDAPPTPTSVSWKLPAISDWAAPKLESLAYAGKALSDDEKHKLAASQGVLTVEVVGKAARALQDYRTALTLSRDLARKLNGFLWDDETRTADTVESWSRRLDSWKDGIPDLEQHVALDAYRDGELIRLVSLGMIKFGLPDVCLNRLASNDQRTLASLANLTLQIVLEQQKLDGPGLLHASFDRVKHPDAREKLGSNPKANAQRKLDLTLLEGKLEEGDADNRLLEIAFPGPESSLQERHAEAIKQLFGTEDSISYIEHDEAIEAASRRARAQAFKLRPRFAKVAPVGEQLEVKVPFATPAGGNEYMWVEVISWKGKTITGLLDNDPFEIPTLKAGARVEVDADQIFDYTWKKADGTEVGNETGALIEKRAP